MKEIQEILRELGCKDHARKHLALATLVKVEGSAYRRPGARMLILPDGRRIGALSGGCLEADVVERARQVLETGESSLICYDASNNFDLVQEMGCQGAVGILIEAISPSEPYLQFMAESIRLRRWSVLATVIHVTGRGNVRVGEHLGYAQDAMFTDLEDAKLKVAIVRDAVRVLRTSKAEVRTYRYEEGSAQVLLEPLMPPLNLLICGAGEDSIPLAQLAAQLGWQVTVTDPRPSLLAADRFPSNVRCLAMRPERLGEPIRPDACTVAVVMTHNYAFDLALLRLLFKSPARYIGLLGPARRTERLLSELRSEGMPLTASDKERLYSPAGLDIGAETAEEIALSIVGEIQAVINNRGGGSLRQRRAPIHEAQSGNAKQEAPLVLFGAPLAGAPL